MGNPGPMGAVGEPGPAGANAVRWARADGTIVEGATAIDASSLGSTSGGVIFLDAEARSWRLDPVACTVDPLRSVTLYFESDDCTGTGYLLAEGLAAGVVVDDESGEPYALEVIEARELASRTFDAACETIAAETLHVATTSVPVSRPPSPCTTPLRLVP